MKKRTGKRFAAAAIVAAAVSMAWGCGNKEADTESETETSVAESETAEDGSETAAEEEEIVRPESLGEIKLGEYKGIEVETEEPYIVTDEEVDSYIKTYILPQNKQSVDDEIMEGDTANIDYVGTIDGVEFDGGSDEGFDLEIGSGRFIDGFEDGLIGHKKGETVSLDLTFPEDYSPNPDLAGQAVVFEVTINSISEPAALTDEWAAANTDYGTAEEYRNAQKESLVQQTDNEYESQVKSDLFQQVTENSEIKDYPEEALNDLKTDIETQMDNLYTSTYGVSLDEYLESQGISQEEADQSFDETAKSYLSQYMITQAILDAEGITLTEADYEKALDEFAQLSGFSDGEAIKSMYSDMTVLKGNVLWNVACDAIMSTANITETTETAEETQTEEAAQ